MAKNLAKMVPKKYEDWTKKDVRKVINAYALKVKRGEITENTLVEVKKTLKRFFKWLEKGELVSWCTTGKRQTTVTPSDLITEDEFMAMMTACTNSRDRALISLLYESGARIGEVGSMRVRDVSFDEYGVIIWLPKSKTVKRKLRLVFDKISCRMAGGPPPEEP